jgi:hypothetical protein
MFEKLLKLAKTKKKWILNPKYENLLCEHFQIHATNYKAETFKSY